MALLNWIFLKKAAFTTGVVGLGVSPIAAIHSYGALGGHLDISPLKKNLEFLSRKYSEEFGIDELVKEVFKLNEMQPSIDDVFAQDLGYLAMQKTNAYKSEMNKFKKEEQSSFDDGFANYQKESKKHKQTYYDSKGGDRDSMIRRELTKKSFEVFKEEILNFDVGNFTLNTGSDQYTPIKNLHHISTTLIEDQSKWKHIGFFAHELDKGYSADPLFLKSKFDFINFAHKRWFDEVRPFYAWMSLWKYKEGAKKGELMNLYDESTLKNEKIDLTQASYGFPLYSTDSTNKFKDFFKDRVSNHASGHKVFIPKGYTDDSSTSILVESRNMYSNLYIKFAAAASYKYQKKLEKIHNGNTSSSNSYINKREKSDSVDQYKQPTELFQFQSAENSGTKSRIPIKKELIKDNEKQSKNEIADLVEIETTPWVFIRNQAGIHAIAPDIENMASGKTNVYEHFQYRTLQLAYKNRLTISQTLDIDVNSVIDSFKKYLKENLSRLILKYVYEQDKKPQPGFFGVTVPQSIEQYKQAFQEREKLFAIRDKYLFRRKLRESIVSAYSKQKWNVKSDNNKEFEHADPQLGFAGINPYKIQTEENKKLVFEELEKIYDFDLFGKTSSTSKGNQNQQEEDLTQKYIEQEKKYQDQISAYVTQLSLNISAESSHLYSERIFTNNYYINLIIDKFLDKGDLFNEFLFKYLLKKDYLGKGILGNEGFVKVNEHLTIEVPEKLKPTAPAGGAGAGGNDVIDSLKDQNDEKKKQIYGKIDEYLKQTYYVQQLLENESSTPWDSIKYSGEVMKKYDANQLQEKLQEKLQKLSEAAFKENLIFGISNYKEKHYKFLNTLTYLIKDDFEKLISYLSSQISYHQDTYIVFSNTDLRDTKLNLPDKQFSNPYLDRELSLVSGDNKVQFKTETSNIYKYLSSSAFKDSKNKVETGFIYSGLYTSKNTSISTLTSEDQQNIISDTLYRYGSNKAEMNEYILSLSSESDFNKAVEAAKKAVEAAKKAVSSSSDKQWAENLASLQIYVETTSGTTTSTLKTLTLQERKNLFSAYLNNVKVEITNNKINKDKYQTVFLANPDQNYNLTGGKHSVKNNGDDNHEEKLQDNTHFKKKDKVEKDTNTRHKLFQLNKSNVKSFEEFKKYVNQELSPEVFWALVFKLAQTKEVQELAVKDMSSLVTKINPYDMKWVDTGKSEFVKK